MIDLLAIVLGFLLDQLVGDPPERPHPVRWLGRLIQWLEPPLRRIFPLRLGGLILLLVVTTVAGGATWALLALADLGGPLTRLAMASGLVYFGLAARSLARETHQVLAPCAAENWTEARRRLSWIVGRDTQGLPPNDIYRACIETVAENTTDGVIGPMFYAACAGPIGLWIYKAISTLDSMVGYRTPRYLLFGWASARADDLVNFLPARFALVLLSIAALLRGQRAWHALRVGWRDRRNHPSPNSGWAEAAMAGALDVQLGGCSTYSGVPSQKPTLGDANAPLTIAKAQQAIGVMLMTAWLALGIGCGSRALALCWCAALRQDDGWKKRSHGQIPLAGTVAWCRCGTAGKPTADIVDFSETTSVLPSGKMRHTG